MYFSWGGGSGGEQIQGVSSHQYYFSSYIEQQWTTTRLWYECMGCEAEIGRHWVENFQSMYTRLTKMEGSGDETTIKWHGG